MSTLLVDNATIAGAGRAMYFSDPGTLGSEHAKEYYDKNGLPAQNEDRRALFELTTALLLVDELVWEGSSTHDPVVRPELFAPNDPAFGKRAFDAGGRSELAWVYRWFPVFADLRDIELLRSVYLYQTDATLLKSSQDLAVQWIGGLSADRKQRIPEQIARIPKCYRREDHPERDDVRRRSRLVTQLSEDEISMALFISRGLFYRTCTAVANLEGYLPHSYRGAFLQDSVLCEAADWSPLFPYGIPASELLEWVDRTVHQRAQQVSARRVPEGKGVTLGASFFRGNRAPLEAFRSAVAFRESHAGVELRRSFSYLLSLAAADNRPAIDAELREIDKQLASAGQEIKGCLASPPEEEKVFLGLLPNYDLAPVPRIP